MKKFTTTAALLATLFAGPAMAQADTANLAEAEVRKVDREQKKLTLKHGEIRHLDMPPMTMVFQVKDAAMLDKLKAGDRIRFAAEKVPGGFAVTEIRPLP